MIKFSWRKSTRFFQKHSFKLFKFWNKPTKALMFQKTSSKAKTRTNKCISVQKSFQKRDFSEKVVSCQK